MTKAPTARTATRKPAPKAEEPVIVDAPVTETIAPTPAEPTTQSETESQPAPVAAWVSSFFKESAMSTFPTFDFAAPFQTAFTDLQEKAKAAFEKGSSSFGDYNDFAKANFEAFVESGKILASGLQELTTALVSDSRAGFETLTAEVKELAAAKSPTDFLKLQNDLAKKHFDEAVSSASKASEALMKLANEAAQPISNRVSIAVEKAKSVA
jgi:phasin family protein